MPVVGSPKDFGVFGDVQTGRFQNDRGACARKQALSDEIFDEVIVFWILVSQH